MDSFRTASFRAISVALCLALLACERLVHQAADQSPVSLTKAVPAMGSVLTLTVWDADTAKAQMAMDGAVEEVRSIEALSNPDDPKSELAVVNAAAGKGPVEVSEDFFALLKAGLDLAKDTNGWTDPTVGGLVRLWGFDQPLQGETQSIPQAKLIEATKRSVGYEKVLLDAAQKTVSLSPGTRLDFGAFSRGYALDRAAKAIQEYDVRAVKLNLGDQWAFVGVSPEGAAWKVDVQDPQRPSQAVATFEVDEGAVSIRTDDERFFVFEGKRYSRIMDPRTGWPARKTSLTALWSTSAAQADAWANAMFIAGAKDGMKWIQANGGLAALWIPSSAEPGAKDAVRFVEQPKAKVVLR